MTETRSYSGSGTYSGYRVQVRIKDSIQERAQVVSEKFVITKEWADIPIVEVPYWGVNNDLWNWNDMYPHARELRLMPWEAANAIAASFAAHRSLWAFMLEFRFVEVEVKHEYTHREIMASPAFTFENRNRKEWEKFERLLDKGSQ